jgi:hypothetical protein
VAQTILLGRVFGRKSGRKAEPPEAGMTRPEQASAKPEPVEIADPIELVTCFRCGEVATKQDRWNPGYDEQCRGCDIRYGDLRHWDALLRLRPDLTVLQKRAIAGLPPVPQSSEPLWVARTFG